MSVIAVRAALETALNAMSPALATAWENASFTPVNGTPYQAVHILFAQPSNHEFGSRHQEQGFMQVKLMYPQSVGTAVISARAEMLRTTFARGNTFLSGEVTTMVTRTAEISSGTVEGDRFAIAVRIPFNANIN